MSEYRSLREIQASYIAGEKLIARDKSVLDEHFRQQRELSANYAARLALAAELGLTIEDPED